MYYLTIKAKQKNAKRHKVSESEDLQQLKLQASFLHKDYEVNIYTGNWKLIWERERGKNENI